jgi:hypothetical protein
VRAGPPAHARYLERRGGSAHRGDDPLSHSIVLGRTLDAHRLYQELTDPRETRGMS